ncbi:MAG: AraC family transcriptional regulator [Prevotellaceae bacterium]|jgi:AraC-like DNA-binding protein|nr:AraC family transcriptional regulator [Prevotellaceae bacterium]
MNGVKTIAYSNVFLSRFSDNATAHTSMIREHCLLYTYSGEVEISEEENVTRIQKGECAFIRRDNRVGLVKRPVNGEQFKAIFLSFPRKFLRSFYHRTLDRSTLPAESKRQETSVYKLPANRPDIVSLFESITPYFDADMQPTDELLNLKMTEGVYVLLNTDKCFYSSLFDFTEPWKIDILDFMNENYMYNLSMEEIASYTGRSLAVFKRDFKKVSRLSPQKWLIQKRLEAAHDKIRNDGKKVSDVCFEVGFKNLSHFSRVFKEQFGYAPTTGIIRARRLMAENTI